MSTDNKDFAHGERAAKPPISMAHMTEVLEEGGASQAIGELGDITNTLARPYLSLDHSVEDLSHHLMVGDMSKVQISLLTRALYTAIRTNDQKKLLRLQILMAGQAGAGGKTKADILDAFENISKRMADPQRPEGEFAPSRK